MIFNTWVSSPSIHRALRFESSSTTENNQTDEELREALLQRLVERRLLGPARQVTELNPKDLPLRELPPGTTASLYLMYIAFMRQSHQPPAGKSTFYSIARDWA